MPPLLGLFDSEANVTEVLFDPVIISMAGELKQTTEKSTLCPDNTEARKWTRHAMAYVSYRPHAHDLFKQKRMFSGASSLCIQHMVDSFSGMDQCGPEIGGGDKSQKDEL